MRDDGRSQHLPSRMASVVVLPALYPREAGEQAKRLRLPPFLDGTGLSRRVCRSWVMDTCRHSALRSYVRLMPAVASMLPRAGVDGREDSLGGSAEICQLLNAMR